MARMGWDAGPLGRRAEGRTEPVEAVGFGSGRAGLGYRRTSRKSTQEGSGGAHRPELVALLSHDNGVVTTTYGTLQGKQLSVMELSPRGRPTPTGGEVTVSEDQGDEIKEVVWWGEGVLGVADSTYPHPRQCEVRVTAQLWIR